MIRGMIFAGLLGVSTLLTGCQARQMVRHYLSFDALVTDLYEKHVLYNLARRDCGRTMVQMDYKSFSATLNRSLGTSGKVQFFTNAEDQAAGANISLNAFRQAFEPNVNNSTAAGLSISSAPAENQELIRSLYDEQVTRPEEDRIFQYTTNRLVAAHAYCRVQTTWGLTYYVPQEKHAEFADFVHRVSFKPVPVAAPQVVQPAQPVPPAESEQPANMPSSVP